MYTEKELELLVYSSFKCVLNQTLINEKQPSKWRVLYATTIFIIIR